MTEYICNYKCCPHLIGCLICVHRFFTIMYYLAQFLHLNPLMYLPFQSFLRLVHTSYCFKTDIIENSLPLVIFYHESFVSSLRNQRQYKGHAVRCLVKGYKGWDSIMKKYNISVPTLNVDTQQVDVLILEKVSPLCQLVLNYRISILRWCSSIIFVLRGKDKNFWVVQQPKSP